MSTGPRMSSLFGGLGGSRPFNEDCRELSSGDPSVWDPKDCDMLEPGDPKLEPDISNLCVL